MLNGNLGVDESTLGIVTLYAKPLAAGLKKSRRRNLVRDTKA